MNQLPPSAWRRNGLLRTMLEPWGEENSPGLRLLHPTFGSIELTKVTKPVCKKAIKLIVDIGHRCREIETELLGFEAQPYNQRDSVMGRRALVSIGVAELDAQDLQLTELRGLLELAEVTFERLVAAFFFLNDGSITGPAFDKIVPASDLDKVVGEGNWQPVSGRRS